MEGSMIDEAPTAGSNERVVVLHADYHRQLLDRSAALLCFEQATMICKCGETLCSRHAPSLKGRKAR
jgi:hypothetical protein